MATFQDPLAWRNNSAGDSGRDKKDQEGEEDRKRDDRIASKNGQEWSLEIPCRQRKSGKGGKVLLQRHLWCPADLRGSGAEMR